MSTRKYVPITAEEFVSFMASQGFIEQKPMSGERIFTSAYNPRYELMIYSSIPTNSGAVRDRGADAIRLVSRDNQTGNHRKAGKILRIETWKENLQKAIDSWFKMRSDIENFRAEKNANRCVECGHEPNGKTDDGKPVCAYHQHVHPARFGSLSPEPLVFRVSAWGM